MPMLFIRCPSTGQPVPTGFDLPKDALTNSSIVLEDNASGPCRHCGQMHVWSKKNAFFLPQHQRP
jgi:endogenous inhibitor of DNA gyrase (YacG/DUF329 family)